MSVARLGSTLGRGKTRVVSGISAGSYSDVTQAGSIVRVTDHTTDVVAMILDLVLFSLLTQAPVSSHEVRGATEAIARGDSAEAAIVSVRGAGRPGLWALHAAAKSQHGPARERLFEAIGHFGGPEAEWALIVELKGSDSHGKAGALRGLMTMKSGRTRAAALRETGTPNETLHDAVIEALVSVKGVSDEQIKKLLEDPSEHRVEVALCYLAQAGSETIARAAVESGLAHDSSRVRGCAVAVAGRLKDSAHVYLLTEIARGSDERLAVAAVEALGKIANQSATGELAAVAADRAAAPPAWRGAARLLRGFGPAGYAALLRCIDRTDDLARRAELTDTALADVSDVDLEIAVEALEHLAAARVILERSGERGIEAATARLAGALPELERAIRAFLSAQAERSDDALQAATAAIR